MNTTQQAAFNDEFQRDVLPALDFADAEKRLNYAHNIAILIKSAQDAAVFLDDIKDYLDSCAFYEKAKSIIERVHTACEAVQSESEHD